VSARSGKLREVFRYEVAHRLRAPSTWIFAAFLGLLGFGLTGADVEGPVNVNAPSQLAEVQAVLGIFGMMITAALIADAALRDLDAGMDPLLFSSPVSKAEYLGGRFTAALAVNILLTCLVPIGSLLFTLLNHEPTHYGPVRLAAFAQPFLILVVPNTILVASILFAITIRVRQAIPVYLGAIAIFVAYLTAANLRDMWGGSTLVSYLDPFGMSALQDVIRYWTPVEQNANLVGLPVMLLWNRVGALAIAAVVLAVLHRAFRFAHVEARAGGRRDRIERIVAQVNVEPAGPVAVPRVAGTFDMGTRWLQFIAVTRKAISELLTSRTFLLVLVGHVLLTGLFGWEAGDSVFDTSTWPTTVLVIERLLDTPLTPIAYLLAAVYAGELVWKDRDVGVAEIADAVPVAEGTLLAGRFVALVSTLTLIRMAIIVGGVITQAALGYYHFEIGVYLRILLGMDLAELAIIAAMAMLIHVVVNQKYLANILVLVACVAPVWLREMGFVRHRMLLYGTDPGWTWSAMNGLGSFLAPFVWFKLYWAAWALVLLVLSVLLMVRGREDGLKRRLRGARARLTGPVARAAATAALLVAGLGGFVFYNTNILNTYRTIAEMGRTQAEYEIRYKVLEDVPQPVLIATDLRVEILPEVPRIDITGGYHLVNNSGGAIERIHVYVDPATTVRTIAFDQSASLVKADEEVGFRTHALGRPLQPGDSLRMRFDLSVASRGFSNDRIRADVVRNGTKIDRRVLPFIGYQPVFELTDARSREHFGLAPQPPMPGPDDAKAKQSRDLVLNEDLVQVDAILGTSLDQTALTPGALRRSWTENGRRYFHYVTERPTEFGLSIYSAAYEVVEDRWKDVALRIYHHPGHTYALDRTLKSMKASLAYFSEQFGPYPDPLLQLVEVPRYGGYGVAHPHTMSFTEDFFLSRVRDGEVDLPFYGISHEVGHQWWGGMVGGGRVRGGEFLTESLSNYSAIMATEVTYGHDAGKRVYDFQMGHYLQGRAFQSHEVAALDVEGQPYIAYRKGAIAMYTLKEFIGAARVNGALRRFADRFRDKGAPYPTSRDLFAELQAVTPDSPHSVLTDWFETVTLWDVRTATASMEPTGDGQYRVTLEVVARKTRADSIGNEVEAPMDDLVDIGVFAGDSAGTPLHLERHRIHGGAQTIVITVPTEPARAGIDPYNRLIDRERSDNTVKIAGPRSAP